MRELKPCPFCGGRAVVRAFTISRSFVVCCEDCPIGFVLPYDSEEEAVEAWNTRAVEIVRCRDCDSWSGPCEIRPDGIEGVCDGWSATGNVVLTREDDFCSYGARRDEER